MVCSYVETIDVPAGENVDHTIERALTLARQKDHHVRFTHNDGEVVVSPMTTAKEAHQAWFDDREAKRIRYESSLPYMARQLREVSDALLVIAKKLDQQVSR